MNTYTQTEQPWLDVSKDLSQMPIRILGWDKDHGQYVCEWHGSWVSKGGGDHYCVTPTKYKVLGPDPITLPGTPEPEPMTYGFALGHQAGGATL